MKVIQRLISIDQNQLKADGEVSYFYQNIWTTPADLSKGEVNVYNENFFRDLSAYYMEWEVLKEMCIRDRLWTAM